MYSSILVMIKDYLSRCSQKPSKKKKQPSRKNHQGEENNKPIKTRENHTINFLLTTQFEKFLMLN